MKLQKIEKRDMRGLMYLLLIPLLTMASCVKELAVNDPNTLPEVPEGMVRIGLYTSSGDYQIPATRAGQADETTVGNTPWVFVFKDETGDKTFVEAVQAMYNVSEGESYVTLTQTDEKRMLLIIANPPSNFYKGSSETNATFDQDNVAAWLTGKTYDEAQRMLTTALNPPNQTTVPYILSAIPMSGTLPLDRINAETVINSTGVGGDAALDLYRIVAKVTVHNSAQGFTFYDAGIAGASRQGYMFPGAGAAACGGTTNYLSSTSTTPGIANAAPQTAGSGTTSANPMYIYESAECTTSVIIRGRYNGTTGYYRLAFKSKTDGTILPVERNKHYKFEITSVTGRGYATVAEAIADPPSNNITADVYVTDLSSHDIIDNGQYYLGVSNSEFIAYSDGKLDGVVVVTVTTDVTEAMEITPNEIVMTNSTSGIVPVSHDKVILSDGTNPGETILTFTDLATNFTKGKITITLGNLQKTIAVQKLKSLSPDESAIRVTGEYITGKIESQSTRESDWLSLSLDGSIPATTKEVTNLDGPGNIYLTTQKNYLSERKIEDIYLYRHDLSGRVRLHVKQKGLGYYPAFPGVIGYDPIRGDLNLQGRGLMVLFKYGGIIAMYAATHADPWSVDDVAWNPSTISYDFKTYLSFPDNSGIDKTGYKWAEGKYVTVGKQNIDQTFHNTLTNAKIGNGDPCRFIDSDGRGLTVDFVKNQLIYKGKVPDQGAWRLPTPSDYNSQTIVYVRRESRISPSDLTRLVNGSKLTGLNAGDPLLKDWDWLPHVGPRLVDGGMKQPDKELYGYSWTAECHATIPDLATEYFGPHPLWSVYEWRLRSESSTTTTPQSQAAAKVVRCVRQQ